MPKHFADVLINGKYINVSIKDMLWIKKNNPRKFELIKDNIYSTNHDPANKYKMYFVCRKNKNSSHFRAATKQENNGVGYEETITHETYKNIISNLKKLNLVVGQKIISLSIYKSEIEFHKKLNGNDYVIDIYFWFNKSNPSYYVIKWGGELAFEIKHSHSVGDIKRQDFEIAQVALFEHKISPKLTFNTIEDIDKQIEFVKTYLCKKNIWKAFV